MTNLGDWLKERSNIQIAHMDWKYVLEPNADSAGGRRGYWYLVLIYKQ